MTEPVTEREGAVRLVGTAHVSADSVEEVRETIAEERPDVVAVELDEGRYRQMKGDGPDDLEPSDLLRGNTVFQFLAYWMLSYVQTRLGERFDIQPGADMKAAIEAAESEGIPVSLVDRDINVTIQRFWTRLTAREKLSLVGGLLMGFAPPLQIGLAVGVAFGLLAGLVIGAAGAGTLGLGSAGVTALLGGTALQVVGGLVAGLVVGLAVWALAGGTVGRLARAVGAPDDLETRLLGSIVVGYLATLSVVLAGGVALGPLTFTPETLAGVGLETVEIAAGLVVGVAIFGALGLLLGVALSLSVEDDYEDLDDLDMERLTDTDVVSVMMEEFRRFSPRGAEALIDERDAFIAHKLLGLKGSGRDVVAVVGAGHVEGIERHLNDPHGLPPIADLTERAKGRRVSVLKVASYLFMVGFFAFFALLALAGVSQPFLLKLFLAWFLFNGIFAAGMAKLAGARWLSATVGGAIAWLTSINPLLAPGWFAGYVELRYDPVSVADIATLNELLGDTESSIGSIVSRMFDVPLFKLIMVVAATNVGSMVASALFFVVVVPWLGQDVGGTDALLAELFEGAMRGVDVLVGLV